jgi:hypothetical protein
MVDFWEVPKIWPGETVFIIGGGPSIQKQDLSLIYKRRVIGVTRSFKLGPWVDICWYGDKGDYNSWKPDINEYGGLIATCAQEKEENRNDRIKYLGRSKQSGIESKKRGYVAWNSNSGASAINLAYWLGAEKIVLLGFDMQNPVDKRDRQTHWHNDYEPRIHKGKLTNPYPRFMRYWPVIKKDADQLGLRIINCTIGGALEVFERKTIEEVCQDL